MVRVLDTASSTDSLGEDLTDWARGSGAAQAAALIARKALFWLEPTELALYAAGRVWERSLQGGPLEQRPGISWDYDS